METFGRFAQASHLVIAGELGCVDDGVARDVGAHALPQPGKALLPAHTAWRRDVMLLSAWLPCQPGRLNHLSLRLPSFDDGSAFFRGRQRDIEVLVRALAAGAHLTMMP